MRSRFLALLAGVLTLLAAAAAQAGPWPRPVGQMFLASTATLGAAQGWRSRGTDLYLEYGLRPRVTLGFAVEGAAGLQRLDLFARWHPPDLPGNLVWGVTGGLRHAPGNLTPSQLLLGVDLGRGMDLAAGNLWLRGGLRLRAGTGPWGRVLHTDLSAQVGLRRGRWIGMLGATHDHNRFGTQTRLRPALGLAFDRFTLVAEGALPPGGRIAEIRLGVWSEF